MGMTVEGNNSRTRLRTVLIQNMIVPHAIMCCETIELPLYSLRKPKRVRTAFSPAQLLHLERAFEQNRYVVGQERRQLAASLNLSETQV